MLKKLFSLQNFTLPSPLKNLVPKVYLGILGSILTTLPTNAAERIFAVFGPLKFSIRVESLEKYANEGIIEPDLAFYLRFVSEEEQQKFRTALKEPAQIDPVLLSRLLNTEIGEDILTRLGKIINIPWGINGKYPIRGALVKSAFEPEGLTLLGFLQKFSTDLEINVDRTLAVAERVDKIVNASELMVSKVEKLSEQEAKKEDEVNFANLPDLSKSGEYGSVTETLTLTDASRNRTFQLVLYKPQRWKTGQTPVIVLSHGLASRPEDFKVIGEHLASHGYLVAAPQHIGSDFQQAKDLIEGFSREVFDLNEFINRPLDISYVIDYLEQQNQTVYQGRLNLTNVGVGGHSFGGYGALAVAGAEIDFDYLEKECDLTVPRLNTSLLLQCRALALPRKAYNFRDQRVTSVITLNPVNSSVFGPNGLGKIEIPVLTLAGTYDPATPAIYEQFRSFPWFGSQNKYLGLIEGQAHVSFANLDPGVQETIKSLDFLTLPSPQILEKYGKSLTLLFFQTYVAKDQSAQPYLNSFAGYSKHLSQGEQFKVFGITEKSSPAIEQQISELGIIKIQ
jgi:predicted dienelactone hydrolase